MGLKTLQRFGPDLESTRLKNSLSFSGLGGCAENFLGTEWQRYLVADSGLRRDYKAVLLHSADCW